jgi:hypothetical protein
MAEPRDRRRFSPFAVVAHALRVGLAPTPT